MADTFDWNSITPYQASSPGFDFNPQNLSIGPSASARGDFGPFNISSPQTAQSIGLASSLFGVASQAIGTYYSAKSQQDNLKFQAEMAKINARMAETQAQHIMDEARAAIGQVGLKAGKIKGAQRAAMAANGVRLGVGSAKEVVATTDLMKEIDSLTINANAVRAAGAARMQGANYAGQAAMAQGSAGTISPFGLGATSLLTGAGQVAGTYYQNKMLRDLAARGGV